MTTSKGSASGKITIAAQFYLLQDIKITIGLYRIFRIIDSLATKIHNFMAFIGEISRNRQEYPVTNEKSLFHSELFGSVGSLGTDCYYTSMPMTTPSYFVCTTTGMSFLNWQQQAWTRCEIWFNYFLQNAMIFVISMIKLHYKLQLFKLRQHSLS